jgi:hypothetical protein
MTAISSPTLRALLGICLLLDCHPKTFGQSFLREDGASTPAHPQQFLTDQPYSLITGTHRDKEWVYGFLNNGGGIAQQKVTSVKESGSPVFSDDEWIVTKTLRPDGTGFASSLLRFYDARSLLLKHTLTVPNDVFHLDRSATRNQFLLAQVPQFE